MSELFKWNVIIEYGPTGTDVHYITVESATSGGAIIEAEKWARDNNISFPMFGEPYKDTNADSFEDFIEWTPEEEEAFISKIDMDNDFDLG